MAAATASAATIDASERSLVSGFLAPAAADTIAVERLSAGAAIKPSSLARAACHSAVTNLVAELRSRGRPEVSPLHACNKSEKDRDAAKPSVPLVVDTAGTEDALKLDDEDIRAAKALLSLNVGQSQAVALQIKMMHRAREEAQAEVARARKLEAQAVRVDEEGKCRVQLHRRLQNLEDAHSERAQALAAREKVAAERLSAREEEGKRRASSLQEDLAIQMQDMVLRRSAADHAIAQQHQKLDDVRSQLARREQELHDGNACVAKERRDLDASKERNAEEHAMALRSAREAYLEQDSRLSARASELECEKRAVAMERERLAGMTDRLEASERAERSLRADVVRVHEELCTRERELADMRTQLEVLVGDLYHARSEVERTAADADASRRDLSAEKDKCAVVEQELLHAQIGCRDKEDLQRRRADATEAEHLRSLKKLELMRAELDSCRDASSLFEESFREKMGLQWNQERAKLLQQLDQLQDLRRQDASERAGLQRQVQRLQKDFVVMEEGWWDWMRSIGNRLPPDALRGLPRGTKDAVDVT